FYSVPEFAPDQIYVYKYEAKLMGGMPEEGLARAGVKILSKVQLHADSSNNVTLQLDAPQFFEYKGKWAKDDSITANFTQHLTPVKFQYTNGNVGKVYAPAAIPKTLLNIYRGIINIFQIKIKNTQNVYELQELGAQGTCKTQYIISDDQKAERIYLTKTKDLNQCQDKVVNDIGLSYMEKCPECERKSRALNGASFYNYTLKPEANSARLLEATVTEIYQYAPFETMHGGPQMESRQNLIYLEQKSAPVESNKNTEYNQSSTLLYEFGSEVYQTPFSLLDPSSRLERSESHHLGSSNRDRVHEESPLKYIALIQLLREAQYERILTVWNQIKDNQDQRHWILNAIPAIRSHVALQFVMDRFLKKELSSLEAAHVLLVSVHLVKASNEAIKFYTFLIVLWNIVLLGYGTLVAKQCVENPGCSSDLVKPFHERLAQAVERQEIEKIITSLKVLGNAGHLASYKPIQKVLPGFGSTAANLPLRVHIEAVLALRNIAKNHPRPVQETVIQLFMSKEHQELRMAAAIVLFETKPSTGLVMTLANAIAKENNDQISSFIYSYMKSMTKSAAPDFESVSAACSLAIRVLSPRLDRQSYRYSRSLYADTYNYPWMVGAAASAYYINEAAAFLPKTVVAKARAYLAGAYADVLEIGVRSEGIQEALVKNQNIPQNEQRVNKMKAILKALSSWKAEPSSQPLASAYVKIFGQEVAYATLCLQLAKEVRPEIILREVLQKLMSGYKHYYAQPLLLSEIRRILPTAIGLPMSLSLYTSAVVVVPVNGKTLDPPLARENFRLAQLLKSDIRMSAVITPSVSAHTYAVMGVNTDQFKAAVMSRARVHSVVPAKMEARVDMTGATSSLSFCLFRESLSLQSRVCTGFIAPLIGKKRCLEKQTFGYKICGETQAYNASYIRASPLYSMIGKQLLNLQLLQASESNYYGN
uniref:Vitellogenin domain-containing protein n=1 Tax=Salarias fasciatus TaxID=181472 RepID=A0A672JLQ0_SALFA